MRLDADLLTHPPGLATLRKIAVKFKLRERYGITLAGLRMYADEFEKLARPVVASQIIAHALGCLPENYRQEVAGGGQVLLLSQVLAVLTAKAEPALKKDRADRREDQTPPPAELSVADLAKLATILSNIARRWRSDTAGGKKTASCLTLEPYNLAEAVRSLYGLIWPPPDQASKVDGHGESGRNPRSSKLIG